MLFYWLTDSPGLYDPCEREPTDLCTLISLQDRENITISAQVRHTVPDCCQSMLVSAQVRHTVPDHCQFMLTISFLQFSSNPVLPLKRMKVQ